MKKKVFYLGITLGILVFAGCGNMAQKYNPGTGTNTSAPEVTSTIPESTPVPTETSDNNQNQTGTVETKPTDVPTPTSTNTPVPTDTPTPIITGTPGEVSFLETNHFIGSDLDVKIVIASGKEGKITYTLDGTEPLETSSVYEGGIYLTCGDQDFPKCTTIMAKAWYSDGSSSSVYCRSFFTAPYIDERYHCYVLSVVGDPNGLTEGNNAIFKDSNLNNRGREWERKVHLEMINSDGTDVFSQFAGARIYGGKSRELNPIKSLKFYARKEYEPDKGTFKFDGFGTTTVDGKKTVKKYDKLVIRSGGDDFNFGYIRDELAHTLAKEAGFATYEGVVPVICYLNGEYYGYYWMHESYCDEYFQRRNGESDGEYVVIEGGDQRKFLNGDDTENAAATEFNNLYKKYAYSDLTNDKTYNELSALVDINNYLDYMSYNIYISSYDWPERNVKCFRYYANNGVYGEGEKDGRWRFLLHDMDVAFGCWATTDYKTADADRRDITPVVTGKKKDGSTSERYSPLLQALLKRQDCQDYFLARLEYYMTEAVTAEKVASVLAELQKKWDPELPYFYEYMKTKGYTKLTSNTEKGLKRIPLFMENRETYIRKEIASVFGK